MDVKGPAIFVVGIALLAGLHSLGRPRHEATVDRPTLPRAAPLPFGHEIEMVGGRRWLILRTGGAWR